MSSDISRLLDTLCINKNHHLYDRLYHIFEHGMGVNIVVYTYYDAMYGYSTVVRITSDQDEIVLNNPTFRSPTTLVTLMNENNMLYPMPIRENLAIGAGFYDKYSDRTYYAKYMI